MQADPQTKQYLDCNVLMLGWEQEEQLFTLNRMRLAEVFCSWSYNVHHVWLDDWCQEDGKVDLRQYIAFLDTFGGQGKLVIVCYVGHGRVERSVHYNDGVVKWNLSFNDLESDSDGTEDAHDVTDEKTADHEGGGHADMVEDGAEEKLEEDDSDGDNGVDGDGKSEESAPALWYEEAYRRGDLKPKMLLMASDTETDFEVPITLMQYLAVHGVLADALFVLDCCFGGEHELLDLPHYDSDQHESTRHQHCVQTIAACDGDSVTYARGGHRRDFSWALASDLEDYPRCADIAQRRRNGELLQRLPNVQVTSHCGERSQYIPLQARVAAAAPAPRADRAATV